MSKATRPLQIGHVSTNSRSLMMVSAIATEPELAKTRLTSQRRLGLEIQAN